MSLPKPWDSSVGGQGKVRCVSRVSFISASLKLFGSSASCLVALNMVNQYSRKSLDSLTTILTNNSLETV